MTTDEVVLEPDTPQELEAAITKQGLRNVATMRAPRCRTSPCSSAATDLAGKGNDPACKA